MIRGEKVSLRPVRETDLDSLFELINDLDLRGEYLDGKIYTEVDFKNRFHRHGFWEEEEGFLLICAAERVVGRIGYSKTMPYFNGLELWYMIFKPEDRNKGYTSEALRLMVKYLFNTRPINRLQLLTDSQNQASRRVAEKCGFTFEGTARGAVFHRGEHHSQDFFSILREEVDL
ncbi:MAG: GNAT family N-acetyltransferase [Chloroflexi bacterium]|nr:GNAT family N-acetyltransferase [Chloroflexota bacterium]